MVQIRLLLMIKTIKIYLEENQKINDFYKKRFKIIYYILPLVQIISVYSMIYCLHVMELNAITILKQVFTGEFLNYNHDNNIFLIAYKNYFKYLGYIYFSSILFDDIIKRYLIFKYKNLILYSDILHLTIFIKTLMKLVLSLFLGSFINSLYFVEPNVFTHFINTKTFVGRGFDFQSGSLVPLIKGDFIASVLGKDLMLEAVEKYCPDSKIVDEIVIQNIFNDQIYSQKLKEKLTFIQAKAIGFSGSNYNIIKYFLNHKKIKKLKICFITMAFLMAI